MNKCDQPGPSLRLKEDPEPQLDSFAPTKRPRSAFSAREKLMTMNVYNYLCKHWRDEDDEPFKKTECVNKTAEILGVCSTSVYRCMKEVKENENFSNPKKAGPKRNFKDKIDEAMFKKIRWHYYQFIYRNEVPTIKKVTKAVCDDSELPNFSNSTMARILKHLKVPSTFKPPKTKPEGFKFVESVKIEMDQEELPEIFVSSLSPIPPE